MATTTIGSANNPPSALFLGAGSATTPSLSLPGTGAGIYQLGTNGVDFATNGTFAGEITGSQRWLFNDGSVGTPILAFANDTDTGIYRAGTNQMTLVSGGGGVAGNAELQITSTSAALYRSVNSGTSFSVYNDFGTRTSLSCSLGLANRSNSIDGGINFIKYANGFSGTTAAGNTLSNSGGFTISGDNIARWIWQLSNNSGCEGIYFEGGSPTNNVFAIRTDSGLNQSRTIQPFTDNTFSCGASGVRWTAVWAANGTIQTSHSSTKEVLSLISEDTPIPDGILFKRPGSDRIHVGFLADDLPKEAFYEDGVSVETSAPIGVLCVKLKQAFREIDALKEEIKKLKGE